MQIDHVDINTLGILWFSDKRLTEFPDHYVELDYLFDGAISVRREQQKERHQEQQNNKELFVTRAFARDFFLNYIHVNTDVNTDVDIVDEVKKFAEILYRYVQKNNQESEDFKIGLVHSLSLSELSQKKYFSDEVIRKINQELKENFPKFNLQIFC
ncbi:MAG: hypothetical protein HQK49_00950 [Oligoflexia bacterium]|nr:hypothetical protein [Oligoflexia bacterium]